MSKELYSVAVREKLFPDRFRARRERIEQVAARLVIEHANDRTGAPMADFIAAGLTELLEAEEVSTAPIQLRSECAP